MSCINCGNNIVVDSSFRFIPAALGISVVVRQAFYGGHYSLIDSKTLDPNPAINWSIDVFLPLT
jgi:hypothetical protein